MRKHTAPGDTSLAFGLEILHEDRDLIVVNKPAGMNSIPLPDEKERNACSILLNYVRKGAVKSRARIFIVHRLDQWTSGVLIFAKSEEAKVKLKANWAETRKKYLAIVHGKLDKDSDTIANYLTEKGLYHVQATENTVEGKLARTGYLVLKQTKKYSLLEIDLITGRKHQIRVHMAGLGHPIAGDRKYGKPDPQPRLMLHAYSITFIHPFSGKAMTFTAQPPAIFKTVIGEFEA